MKIYNVIGFATLAFHVLLSAFLAPPWLGPWWGIVVGFAYLLISWLLGGLYLSDVIHLGIAHRALDYKAWKPILRPCATLIPHWPAIQLGPLRKH
jgi:hypothetical protein